MWVEALRRCGNLIRGTQASRFFRNRRRPRTRQRSRSPRTARSGIRRGEAWTLRLSVCCIRTWIRSRRWARTIRMARRAIRTSSPLPRLARRGKSIPLLAEEGWRDSLIEAGAPGAKREPDRAKPQLVVSSAGLFPHLPCRIHDQLQFPPLIIFRKKVPGSYGSKSALRTEREIVQGNKTRGLVNPAAQFVLRFQLWLLCCHESEDYIFSVRHQTQRFNTPGALSVVFQQECIDIQPAEEFLGDDVVSSFGVPAATTVSAADMERADKVILTYPSKAGVVAFDSAFKLGVGVPACLPHSFALSGIEVVRIIGRIELDVSHPLRDEPLDLIADNLHKVASKIGMGRIKPVRYPGFVARQQKI